MKTKKIAVLAFALAMSASGAAIAGSILGDTVTIGYRYPASNTVFAGDTLTGVVTESGLTLTLFPIEPNVAFTVFGNYVQMVGIRNPSSNFVAATFNGFSIQDLTNPGAFANYSVDPASNLAGFGSSNVSLSGGILFLNFEGLTTPFQSLAQVDFAPVPLPTPAWLFSSSLFGLTRLCRKWKAA